MWLGVDLYTFTSSQNNSNVPFKIASYVNTPNRNRIVGTRSKASNQFTLGTLQSSGVSVWSYPGSCYLTLKSADILVLKYLCKQNTSATRCVIKSLSMRMVSEIPQNCNPHPFQEGLWVVVLRTMVIQNQWQIYRGIPRLVPTYKICWCSGKKKKKVQRAHTAAIAWHKRGVRLLQEPCKKNGAMKMSSLLIQPVGPSPMGSSPVGSSPVYIVLLPIHSQSNGGKITVTDWSNYDHC